DSATIAGMDAPVPRRFERYVAMGDSSTEGIDDPDESGGYRGWSRRLAQRIAEVQGSIWYANFGVRGRTTHQILRQQLAPALAMRPDLATVFSGTNDVAGRRFDVDALAHDMEEMQRALIAGGATVLTFTLPDLTPVMPIARWIAPRIRALNEALRGASARTGAILLDFAAYSVGSDPRIWSVDRIHANAIGHTRIAEALAHALELPGTDDSWSRPLPPLAPKTRWEWLAAEMNWTRRYLLPWIGRGLRSRLADSPRERGKPTLQLVEAGPPACIAGSLASTALAQDPASPPSSRTSRRAPYE
ncbi:MAG TPA: SGNH/GDSL hydrolase family protein, partial [Candidatus Limnocylindria bacterium]|nr:SGNH/GDSL hydrolase family protein [Candidatus Limnocylindria bacterium]